MQIFGECRNVSCMVSPIIVYSNARLRLRAQRFPNEGTKTLVGIAPRLSRSGGRDNVHIIPHARNLPLPVISRRPSSITIRRAACGVASSAFATIPADTNGFAMTSSTSSGNFDDIRRPSNFRSIIVFAKVSRSCSFIPISAAAKKPWAMARSRVS